MGKKYYWFKMQKDFFKKRAMKKLRTIAGGDTYTIIYLKLILLSLENDGLLLHEEIEDNLIEELSLDIDENVEDVKVTINFLERCNLIVITDSEIEMQEAIENTGSETSSAARVRKFRAREQQALPCNSSVTKRNTELEKEIEIEKDNREERESEREKSESVIFEEPKEKNTSKNNWFDKERVELAKQELAEHKKVN